jgi:hypothetical protein
VLLSLFVDEIEAVTTTLGARFEAVPIGDLPALAGVITDTVLARPRFCQLLSIMASVLEQNLSVETIADFKRQMRAPGGRLATALNRIMPTVTLEDCGQTWTLISVMISALWPVTHPSANAAKVYELAEFAGQCMVPERDILRAVLVILRGVTAAPASPA